MPDNALPEGTDQVVDTNIDAGTAPVAVTPSGGATTGGAGGGAGGSAGASDSADQSATNKASDSIVNTLKEQVSTLRGQATDRARTLADDGKSQATSVLQDIAAIIADAAAQVEERLGGQYAGVGHTAADKVNSLAGTLDQKSIEDLVEDARAFARRSPAVAIGVAALAGFAVARVLRTGLGDLTGGSAGSGRADA